MTILRLPAVPLALLIIACTSVTTLNQRQTLDRLYGEHQIYESFYDQLSAAILTKNATQVAELVHYPVRIITVTGTEFIADKSQFIARFDDIITPTIINAVRQQTFGTLFANSNGLMISAGQIWFTGICTGHIAGQECDNVIVRVITFNNRIGG